MKKEKIKIAIAEDQALILEGLTYLLHRKENFEVIKTARNGEELVAKIKVSEEKPDVFLLDISMPILDGYKTARLLKGMLPEAKIIYLTGYDDVLHIEKAVKNHAAAFVSKNNDYESLKVAIRDVCGKQGIHFNDFLTPDALEGKFPKIEPVKLADREKEFIRLLCLQKDMKQIAEEMGITISTAQTYRKRILEKIGAKKTAGIVTFAIENRLF